MNEMGFLKALSGEQRHSVALQLAEYGLDRIPKAGYTLERLTGELLVQDAICKAAGHRRRNQLQTCGRSWS